MKRLSAITAQLESLDFVAAPVFVINGLKGEELIASNSMILHELYFASLSEESQPDGALRSAFTRDFGSVEKWQTQFVAMGKALGGGSGWVLLTYSPRDKKLVNQWAADLLFGRSEPDFGSRYVRARVPHGLRRESSRLRRCLHQ